MKVNMLEAKSQLSRLVKQALEGKAKQVRWGLIAEMEGLLRLDCLEGHDSAGEVEEAVGRRTGQLDLCWVKAEPISALARTWLSQHPGATMRQSNRRRVGRTGNRDWVLFPGNGDTGGTRIRLP